MEKNFFDKISDSYDNFHLKESEIHTGKGTIHVSPKIKLILGWSLFVLFCILAFIISMPSKSKTISEQEKKELLKEKVNVNEEHDTLVPYKKDANKELNAFIEKYLNAITECDYKALQGMVADDSMYQDDILLKKKAEFITKYDNLTVYTKDGYEKGSYLAFVVADITITGVNSKPYDVITLYIEKEKDGFVVQNGKLSKEATEYIVRLKGDKDIQKIYQSVEKKNNGYAEKDETLKQFYEVINGKAEPKADSTESETEENTEENTDSEAE